MNLLKRVKKFFTKSKEKEPSNKKVSVELPREDLFNLINTSQYDDVTDYTYKEDGKVLFIMDDIDNTMYLYKEDFELIKNRTDIDVRDHITIRTALGKHSGFIAYKYIKQGGKVDYALLDITMDSITRFKEGILDIDGIDIAIMIAKSNPDAKIILSTLHTLDKRNNVMRAYIEKFEAYFCKDNGTSIKDYYMDKSNRIDRIHNLLKEEIDNAKVQ